LRFVIWIYLDILIVLHPFIPHITCELLEELHIANGNNDNIRNNITHYNIEKLINTLFSLTQTINNSEKLIVNINEKEFGSLIIGKGIKNDKTALIQKIKEELGENLKEEDIKSINYKNNKLIILI
jgi:leucyl-tRNA synthetase